MRITSRSKTAGTPRGNPGSIGDGFRRQRACHFFDRCGMKLGGDPTLSLIYTPRMHPRLVFATLLSLVTAGGLTSHAGSPSPLLPPLGTPTELGLQGSAKVLCSAVFVSGRTPEEFVRNSGFWFMPAGEEGAVTWSVDCQREVGRRQRPARSHAAHGSTRIRAASSIALAKAAWNSLLSPSGRAARRDDRGLADGRSDAERTCAS